MIGSLVGLLMAIFGAMFRPGVVAHCVSDGDEGEDSEGGTDGDDSGDDGAGDGDDDAGDGDGGLAKKFGAEAAEYIRGLRRENAQHRTKLRETEAKVKEYEDRDLTEAEKTAREIEELRAGQERAKEFLIRGEVKAQAAEIGIIDSDAAMRLLDRDGIAVDDEGNVSGVKKALEALVEAKPYLKGEPKRQQSGADMSGGNNDNRPGQDIERDIRAAFGR
jgi:hypothetical protein